MVVCLTTLLEPADADQSHLLVDDDTLKLYTFHVLRSLRDLGSFFLFPYWSTSHNMYDIQVCTLIAQ